MSVIEGHQLRVFSDRLGAKRGQVLLYVVLCGLPLLTLAWSWKTINRDNWQHLFQYLLAEAALNTLRLEILVVTGAVFLGVVSAWVVACFEFPGRSIFRVVLALPLGIPKYVIGFAYLSLIDYGGPFGFFDRQFGTELALWFHLNSWLPVSYCLAMALYPYVYLSVLPAIELQGRSTIEAAMLDGASAWHALRSVILPLCAPAIAGGAFLVAMETLADFGTVAMFSYDTFTVVVYKVWYSLFDLDTAAQLSLGLIFLLLPLCWLRLVWLQKNAVTSQVDYHALPRQKLKGSAKLAATALMSSIFFLAFVLPLTTLLILGSGSSQAVLQLTPVIFNTIGIACAVALGVILSSTVQITLRRLVEGSKGYLLLLEVSNLGYALPGTILAVGVLQLIWLLGPAFSGTLFATILGLTLRFQMIGVQTLWVGVVRVPRALLETSILEGASRWMRLRAVYAPFLQGHLIATFVLVFLEAAKEMPITLMTRPFGRDTLAVKIFQFTSEGEFGMAATPALLLAGVALLPQLALILRQKR